MTEETKQKAFLFLSRAQLLQLSRACVGKGAILISILKEVGEGVLGNVELTK